MMWKKALVAPTLVAAIAMGLSTALIGSVHAAGCSPEDQIDNTTVADTRQKIEAAGYQEPKNFRKGCDNFWHASATKDGNPVNVLVTPTGEVLEEGD